MGKTLRENIRLFNAPPNTQLLSRKYLHKIFRNCYSSEGHLDSGLNLVLSSNYS